METLTRSAGPFTRPPARVRSLDVIATGPLATVQDLGRTGLGALGVGHSGAADAGALRLGNRLLGNPESHAGVEITFGGLEVRAHGDISVAVTGAPCPVTVGGRQAAPNSPLALPDGATLRIGTPRAGLRTYLTVRGGVQVAEVLGSRSTDSLAALGPDPLSPGDRLPVGPPPATLPNVDLAPVGTPTDGEAVLRIAPGPRVDWFVTEARDALVTDAFEVTSESNRVGMRLRGPALERVRHDELQSEGMVCGALQVPPTGQPTLFLADHPVTGGYPVIAVVLSADLGRAAQTRPGQHVRFAWATITPGATHG